MVELEIEGSARGSAGQLQAAESEEKLAAEAEVRAAAEATVAELRGDVERLTGQLSESQACNGR